MLSKDTISASRIQLIFPCYTIWFRVRAASLALRPGRKPRARLRARDPGARDPAAATAFLGTQGGICDTQWDMFLAGVGANAARLERLRSAR